MNELIELWNTYPLLVQLKTWLMTMSITNLTLLVLIIILINVLSLTYTVDGKESRKPKLPFTILTWLLVYLYPNDLLWATFPYLFVLGLIIFNNRLVMRYINWYLPNNRKVL